MPERELSPYSARLALTRKLQQEQGNPAAPVEHKNRPWDSRGPPEKRQNRHVRSPPPRGGKQEAGKPSPLKEREDGRSPPPRRVRDRSPEERLPDSKSKDSSVEPAAAARDREASPEPYRKPRGASREPHRDLSKEKSHPRDKQRSRDRERIGRGIEIDRGIAIGRDAARGLVNGGANAHERERDQRTETGNATALEIAIETAPAPERKIDTDAANAIVQKTIALEISFRGLDNSTEPPTKYGGAPKTLEKPNFKPTGLLAKAANKVEGTKISLKYHEPAEARKPSPSSPWRIFVFKEDEVIDTIELHARSCWLLGRSAEVVDYVLEHPSSSQQHAVIQFRYIQKTVEDEFGVKKVRSKVKPYVIDLESSNGTELNGARIETSRYIELRDKDILKFAGSEREYVVMLPPPEEKRE
ncbi:hypothetical protein N0V90_010356 [Kalmusia sp. IMI 367209]|nr:hypothetical protein N0V90_010356 [Kalmusia sp. IMI 367209]